MGRFESGKFRAVGPSVSVTFNDGTFSDGTFSDGTFSDGTFSDGTFCMCTDISTQMIYEKLITISGNVKSTTLFFKPNIFISQPREKVPLKDFELEVCADCNAIEFKLFNYCSGDNFICQ